MLNKAWYELSPAIYLIVSVNCLIGDNRLAAFSGFILFLVSLLIVVMRVQYRTASRQRQFVK